eukprot:3061949-Rhodomonas_salina.2
MMMVMLGLWVQDEMKKAKDAEANAKSDAEKQRQLKEKADTQVLEAQNKLRAAGYIAPHILTSNHAAHPYS